MSTAPRTPLQSVVRQMSFATGVAAALSITACQQQPPKQQASTRICTDPSGARIPDENCHRSGGGAGSAALWYFGAAALARTAYGQRATGGSYTAPESSRGFGATARGTAGG
ncbi:hypothetical protein [Brevundimonas sp. M20]|uniref:hypothetical protein n=1 Tax=Brevundimonas sp. M20 TaxID=2591463 RepID=UPI001146E764|nr:hypothetical protein [Brevundimonas sp. M20]QDH73902.1 hypothetical protein FKQ52_11000 [Brevundimonas sp. M20]